MTLRRNDDRGRAMHAMRQLIQDVENDVTYFSHSMDIGRAIAFGLDLQVLGARFTAIGEIIEATAENRKT